MDFLEYLTDAVEDKIINLMLFQGYVTEADICEIINNQTGMDLRGDEKKVFTPADLGMEAGKF